MKYNNQGNLLRTARSEQVSQEAASARTCLDVCYNEPLRPKGLFSACIFLHETATTGRQRPRPEGEALKLS